MDPHAPDSSGFGDYTGCRVVIPCRFNQDACSFTAQMFLDNGAPIAAGREIWGYPMKRAQPTLKVVHDTLTGTLIYAGQNVAAGTMAYKHESHACNHAEILAEFQRTQVNLKLIPHVDGTLAIVQLVGYRMVDVTVLGAWSSPGRLDLASHVNAPIADLPVKRIVGGKHFAVNLTLPYGRVLHDYRKAPKMVEA